VLAAGHAAGFAVAALAHFAHPVHANPDPYYQQGGDMVRVGGMNGI